MSSLQCPVSNCSAECNKIFNWLGGNGKSRQEHIDEITLLKWYIVDKLCTNEQKNNSNYVEYISKLTYDGILNNYINNHIPYQIRDREIIADLRLQ